MILGLHHTTAIIAAVFIVALAVLGAGLFMLRRRSGRGVLPARWLLSIAVGLVAVVGAYWAYTNETGLNARDAVIAQKLASHGITIVDAGLDDRITVQNGPCVATYSIPAVSLVRDTTMAPLNAGSGVAVRGCGSTHPDDLDKIFISFGH